MAIDFTFTNERSLAFQSGERFRSIVNSAKSVSEVIEGARSISIGFSPIPSTMILDGIVRVRERLEKEKLAKIDAAKLFAKKRGTSLARIGKSSRTATRNHVRGW